MTSDAATLAVRFARALEQLRVSYDVQYVGAHALPRAADDEHEEDEGEAAAPEAPPPSSATPALAVPEATRASSAGPEATRPSAAPQAARSPAAARPSSAAPSRAPLTAPASAAASASAPAPAPAPAPSREALRERAQSWTPARKLEYLQHHNVGDCQRCPLARTRNRIVFGVGSPEAKLMFVGEAPGADEDRQGEPFVGRAGQLLNHWLEQLGLARADVYIANVLKCRPPGNRDPRSEEVERCSPFLQAQIRAIEPKVIVALGRHAGVLLSGRDSTLHAMRSSSLHYDAGTPKGDPNTRISIPLVVTYHPSYVLRQESDDRSAAPGRPSPTALVMADLQRALTIAAAV